MHVSPRWLLPLSLVAALAACNQPAAGHSAAAPATAADTAADTAASGFVLTMDKVDAYYATIGKLSVMVQQDPELGEDDPVAMDASESIDAYIARMQADPKARRLITAGGMSVSDYAHTNAALMEGMMTAGALDSGALKSIPDGINPQYVEFARQHKAELAAKMEALQKQFGG